MEKQKRENRVKWYGVVIGLFSLAAQHGIYLLANTLAGVVGNESILPIIDQIDNAIPVLPIFVIPYVWAYLFWGMAPMAASKCKTDHFKDFLAAYLIACVVGGLILVFVPTYMDRVAEGLWTRPQDNFLEKLLHFWYSLDGSERAYNLFPSFHCINSTICYLAVAGRKEVPLWFRVYSLVIAVMIFAATLFVKQHYLIDVVSGILIAAVAFAAAKRWHLGNMFNPLVAAWNKAFKKA